MMCDKKLKYTTIINISTSGHRSALLHDLVSHCKALIMFELTFVNKLHMYVQYIVYGHATCYPSLFVTIGFCTMYVQTDTEVENNQNLRKNSCFSAPLQRCGLPYFSK